MQTTGGHAIVERTASGPSGGGIDPCQNLFVDVFRDGQADERITGASSRSRKRHEPDADRDLRGEQHRGRTDLRLSVAPARDAAGRIRTAVTVTDAAR